ncbi:hypothetical protein Dsin_008164 [Dipteronia sinensis]|uniref:Nudix hydrolase domain-containing protein n=1 Tax=Dipteronia sinensis TaxID=43782 RepID=A0AAE0B1W5_9ROSI|nr:hypothetical protein Dsin_008164 [Dipteronia sinensis]
MPSNLFMILVTSTEKEGGLAQIPDGPSMLLGNTSHHVGLGGFVVNDNYEVLVVQEKYCNPSFIGLQKLPTKEIYKGAIREVKEEIGIDYEFIEVVAFRHAHEVVFEKSDMFFVCILKPVSCQIKVDDLEIQVAKGSNSPNLDRSALSKGTPHEASIFLKPSTYNIAVIIEQPISTLS